MAALGGLLFGFDTAVISGAEGHVKVQFHLSELMEGWIVSSALVGCLSGRHRRHLEPTASAERR